MQNIAERMRQLKITGFCLVPALFNWYFYRWRPQVFMRHEFAPTVSALDISILLASWLGVMDAEREERNGGYGAYISSFEELADYAKALDGLLIQAIESGTMLHVYTG
jgi:hypothetical protein